MRQPRRRAAFLAATCLSLSLAANDFALAQDADPQVAPPARVGRLAATAGSVSFHTAGTDGWQDAVVNTPVTTGDAAFAQTGGHAEIEAANSIVALDSGSELDIAALDDIHFQTSEPQGRIFVDLGQQPAGAVTSVATPRGTVTFDGPGEFEIAAGDQQSPTIVTAIVGTAQIASGALALTVPAGSAATVTGTDQLAGSVAAAGPPDDFLRSSLDEVAHLSAHTVPPAVAGMTGYESLATTGTWQPVAQYGQVWYPPVAASWVPYREGHWSYVAPWGWTWIDDAPWGFAPFHYGRWAYIDDRWGWVPGDPAYAQGYGGPEYDGEPEPVCAPALVIWGDFGAGVAVGALGGALIGGYFGGHRRPSVGWLPLGPGEAYAPPYGGGRAYFDRVNARSVRDVRGIDPARADAGRNFGQFSNRRGATIMTASALQRGENVQGNGGGFPRAALGASPVLGRHVLGAPAAGIGRAAVARGPSIEAANFHPGEGGRIGFRGDPAAPIRGVAGPAARPGAGPGVGVGAPTGVGPRGGDSGLPALRGHDAVMGGRPGAAPEIRAGEAAGVPARAGENGHAGLIAGAAVGAVGAGLAAHAIANRPPNVRAGAPEAAPGRAEAFRGAAPPAFGGRAPTAVGQRIGRPGLPAVQGAAPAAARLEPPRARAEAGARPAGGAVHVITPSGGGGFRSEGPASGGFHGAAPPPHFAGPPPARFAAPPPARSAAPPARFAAPPPARFAPPPARSAAPPPARFAPPPARSAAPPPARFGGGGRPPPPSGGARPPAGGGRPPPHR